MAYILCSGSFFISCIILSDYNTTLFDLDIGAENREYQRTILQEAFGDLPLYAICNLKK